MPLRSLCLLVSCGLLTASAPVRADWLIFLAGGLQETRGGWEVRGPQVRFHTPSGTFTSVRAEEVDLAASAFVSWQAGERRAIHAGRPPVGAELGAGQATGAEAAPPVCAPIRIVRVVSGETLEIEQKGRCEIVHLACVDTPEVTHKLVRFSTLGEGALRETARLTQLVGTLCVTEETPPRRDVAGHRVVYLRLGNGRDLGASLVADGFALVRGGACARAAEYTGLEQRALAQELGHWGASGHTAAGALVAYSTGGGSALGFPKGAIRRG